MDEQDEVGAEQTPLNVGWPTCDAGDTEDCLGARVGGGTKCWAHLSGKSLQEALSALQPGGRLDARGTVLNAALVRQILSAMSGPDERHAHISIASFEDARFLDDIYFDNVTFGDAYFGGAVFERTGSFNSAHFEHYAAFHRAKFKSYADFEDATFGQAAFKDIEFGSADFGNTVFQNLTEFINVRFKGHNAFRNMTACDRTVFVQCRFEEYCNFQNSSFHKQTEISANVFSGWQADFSHTTFDGPASFVSNQFEADAVLTNIKFENEAHFDESSFMKGAWFFDSTFSGETTFEGVKFDGDVLGKGARFDGRADLGGVEVAGAMSLESAGGSGELNLDGLQAMGVVEVAGSFAKVSCTGASLRDRAWFRLSGSELRLDDTAFAGPTTVESALAPPSGHQRTRTPSDPALVRLRSLKGTDAEHLTLVDIDLSRCEFAGLRRPELLHLAGRCRFAPMPGHYWRWGWLLGWWAAREALYEEHIWRHSVNAPAGKGGWAVCEPGAETAVVPPARLAVMYRQLRAGVEDSRNEPGAADLYYGEMEMRRIASEHWGERFLLWTYWLVSGYGLRASRSLIALAAVIFSAAAAFQFVGFPGVTPNYWSCLVYAAGAVLSLNLASRHLPGVLTEWGDVLRIGLRIAGPVLLGLAALAMRGRVKR